MGFKTTRAVRYNGKDYPEGKPIAFPDDEAGRAARDQLLALNPPAIAGGDAKPLAKMNKGELAQVGEEEEVAFPENATQQQMVDAIEAKRAAVGA